MVKTPLRKASIFVSFLHYETAEPYPVTISTGGKTLADVVYRVEKMKYGKKGKGKGKGKDKDLTTLHYNAKITLTGIPLEAYEYVCGPRFIGKLTDFTFSG